jgi:hypothetical protein
MFAFMDHRDEQRAWLESIVASTGLAPTTLATRAGLAPTTLTRFLNDPDHVNALSARTVAAVEKLSGQRFAAPGTAPSLLREPEATPYDAGAAPSDLAEHVRAIAAMSNSLTIWTLRSRALEALGYFPGDILLVDLNGEPRRGDIVCAQIYDWPHMRAETVFRLYEPPYLAAATSDRALAAPKLIDKNVGLKGPVLLSVRGRAA